MCQQLLPSFGTKKSSAMAAYQFSGSPESTPFFSSEWGIICFNQGLAADSMVGWGMLYVEELGLKRKAVCYGEPVGEYGEGVGGSQLALLKDDCSLFQLNSWTVTRGSLWEEGEYYD